MVETIINYYYYNFIIFECFVIFTILNSRVNSPSNNYFK